MFYTRSVSHTSKTIILTTIMSFDIRTNDMHEFVVIFNPWVVTVRSNLPQLPRKETHYILDKINSIRLKN